MATIYLNNPNGQKEIRTQATDAKVYLDGRAPQPVSFEIPEEYKIKQISPSKQQPSPTKGAAAPVNASSAQGTSWDRQTTGEKLDSLLAGEHLGGGAETAKPVTEMDKWLNIGGSAVSGLERGIRGLAAVGDKLTLGGAVRGAAEGVAELTGNEALSNILDALPNPRRDFAEGQSGLSRRSQEVRAQTDNPILGAAADIAGAVGGMLPGIAASVAGGPAAGLAVMGASAGGNAYTEARKEGKGEIASTLYGGAVGASEAFLQKLLGGISAFGKSGVSKLFGDKIDDVIRAVAKNPGVQKTIQYIMGMGSEGAEEYLQSVLEPQVRNVIFGENNELGLTDPDKLYDGLVGALTGGVFELPGYVKSMRGQQNIGQSAQATTPTNTQADVGQPGRQTDIETNTPGLRRDYTPEEALSISKDAKTFSNVVAGKDITVLDFFKKWMSGRKQRKYEKLYLGRTTPEAANQISQILGYDVEQRDYIIANDDVFHIYKEHGDPETEIKRGNLPLSDNIISQLQAVIQSPDKVYEGDLDRQGKTGVVFEKTLSDGTVIYVQFDNAGRETMQGRTLYVKPKKNSTPTELDAEASSTFTSKTTGPEFSNPSIAETTPEVNNSIPAAPENNSPLEALARSLRPEAIAEYRRAQADAGQQGVDADGHTPEMRRIMAEYQGAVDTGIVQYANDVRTGRVDKKTPYHLGKISDRTAQAIRDLTGMDVGENSVALMPQTIEHIDKRHGSDGNADHSMADDADLARIKYVLDNFDDIRLDPNRAQGFFTKDGKTAPKVVISKRIDGTYYVVEAISDAKKKTNYIISAYLQKAGNKKTGQQPLDAEAPQFTSKTATAVPISDSRIAETTPEVNNSIPAAPENNSPFGPNTVGAAESAFPRRTKTSQFRTNTVENTPMFTEAEKNTGFLNNTDSDFTYDVVSERQSLHEAAQRVAMDYEGEKAELPGKTIFDGTDTDTAMLILERLTQEARRTGDFSEVKSWMKMIQERGTEAGQRIQAFAKYSRTPEGTLVKAERYVQNAFEKWARDNPKLAKAMDEAASFLQQAADEYAHELPADPDEAVRNLRKGIEEIAKKRGLDDSFSKTVLEMIQDGKMNKDAASELLRLADGIPTLTTEDVGNILEIMAEAEKLPENSKERLAMENRAYKIVADKFQSSWLDMWNGWRYLAMLGNPTTHLKNRLGNTGFRAVTYAKDALGAALESGADKISRARGGEGIQRTKAVVNPFSSLDKMLYDAAGNDFESIRGIAMGGGKYNPANMIRDNMTIFRTPGSWGTAESSPQAVKAMRGLTDSFTGLLEKTRIKNMDALEAADAVGVKKKYAQALAGYLKANLRGAGIFSSVDAGDVALLDAARAYAIEEAQKATFREYNAVAKKLNELKHINSKTEVIGEGLLPFTKTPANILNRAVEYSPVGLANAILSDSAAVKAGRMTAAQMIDHLASGLTGTGIMLLGALLKSLGILTASGDDDDKKRGFDEMRGAQEYALNIGEYTYTIDWAAPAVIPLFIGAELVKDGEDDGNGITLKNLLNASSKMLDPVVEMSMLKGINDAIRSAAYGGSTPVANIATGAITGYFGQGVPTLFGKVARAVDGTRRRTYADPDSPLPEWIDKPLQKAQAKLPFASGGLHPYVDQWGREQENTGGNFLGRLAYNMLSPGYFEKQESTPVDKELEKLYEATGDSGLLPGYAPKSFTYGGERFKMSGDEYTQYAKTRGQTAYSTLEDIFGSRGYGRASEEQKADMVDAAYSYATYLAKKELLGSEYNPKDRYAKIDKALKEARIDAAASILYFLMADKDGNGSISQEEAKRYLDSSGLTSTQKSYLFALTNSGWKSNPYK